jgi:hypothetical protein
VIGSTIVTLNGLFRLDEEGRWAHFGVNDTAISGLAVDPSDRDVLYTTTLNGLWSSRDGGKSWRFANSWDMTEGQDVAVDPNSPKTVYLALPDGIAVSTDGAMTLARRENGLPERGKYTQVLAVDRTTAGRVLAGTTNGIYLTENQAIDWRRVLPTETTVNDIQQSPHDPSHWLAVTDTQGAWESDDGGLSWHPIDGIPSGEALYNVTFDATDPMRLAVGSWTYGIWTSEDGGQRWGERNAGLTSCNTIGRGPAASGVTAISFRRQSTRRSI